MYASIFSSSQNNLYNPVATGNYTLSSDGADDYINTGMTIDPNVDSLIVYGQFLQIRASNFMGCSETNKRYYFGIGDGLQWQMGWATNTNQAPYAADTLPHKFEIRAGGYFYLDDVLVSDKHLTANSAGILNLYLFAANTTGGVSAAWSKFKLKSATFKGVTFTPQADGTLLGSNGTTYANQGVGLFTVESY